MEEMEAGILAFALLSYIAFCLCLRMATGAMRDDKFSAERGWVMTAALWWAVATLATRALVASGFWEWAVVGISVGVGYFFAYRIVRNTNEEERLFRISAFARTLRNEAHEDFRQLKIEAGNRASGGAGQ